MVIVKKVGSLSLPQRSFASSDNNSVRGDENKTIAWNSHNESGRSMFGSTP